MFALGRLEKIRLASGVQVRFPTSSILVYDKDTTDLLITEAIHSGSIDSAILVDGYRDFHGKEPAHTLDVDWDPKSAKAKIIGLVADIWYSIPRAYKSTKAGRLYRHRFGDHGSNPKQSLPSLFPGLYYDAGMRRYWIERRASNEWYVRDYIIG